MLDPRINAVATSREESLLRAVAARYLLSLTASVLATDRACRRHGAAPLLTMEERRFVTETVTGLSTGLLPDAEAVDRLSILFTRAAGAPHPQFRADRLREAVGLLARSRRP